MPLVRDGWLDAGMGGYGRFFGCPDFLACGYRKNLRKPKGRRTPR